MKRPIHTLLPLLFFLILFASCMKDKSPDGDDADLAEVAEMLKELDSEFFRIGAELGSSPEEALIGLQIWASQQAGIEQAVVEDSAYLHVIMNSGLACMYSIIYENDEGIALTRGGGSSTSTLQTFFGDGDCAKPITNRKVLIFSAGHKEFYQGSEQDVIKQRIEAAGLDLEVTLLKDQQCSIDRLATFGDYGLVIINTHGMTSGFMLGVFLDLTDLDRLPDRIGNAINEQLGPEMTNLLRKDDVMLGFNRKLQLSDLSDWFQQPMGFGNYAIYVTTRYLEKLPPWSNTIVMGNMCYSAYNIPATPYLTRTPIRVAMLAKGISTYYAYAFGTDRSLAVTNSFAKDMEKKIVERLIEQNDSTGVAHLNPAGEEFSDYEQAQLKFRQFADPGYCYDNCAGGNTLTDPRDGEEYPTVCIAGKVWMAANLRYNTGTNRCYDNEEANCETYGRYYKWETVMGGASASSTSPSGVQGVCPPGWHVPSQEEWREMLLAVDETRPVPAFHNAIYSPELWTTLPFEYENTTGLSIIPTGRCDFAVSGGFSQFGLSASYWTTDEADFDPESFAKFIMFNPPPASPIFSGDANSSKLFGGHSCRCVKN